MKKFIAIFLTAVIFFSMATMGISAFSKPTKDNQIGEIDYLDFSDKDDRNRWAKRYEEDVIENGEVIHKKGDLMVTGYTSDDYVNDVYPTALLLPNDTSARPGSTTNKYSFDDKISYNFKEKGEVAVFTSNTTDSAGMSFKVASSGLSYTVGAESAGAIEYVKMRIKNNSASSKFSIGVFRIFGGNSGFDARTVATIDIEPSMDGWTTYIASLRDLNFDQTGTYSWSGGIQEITIFPFGYGDDNEGYEGAEIEIDYIVFGSQGYVTNYESDLEIKENSATDFQFVTPPATTKYYTGDKLASDDFEAEITFDNGTKEIVTSTSAIYNFEKPADLSDDVKTWTTKVQLIYGKQTLSYDVEVVDVESLELLEEDGVYKDIYNKIDILKAGKFTPTGLSLKVNFADGTSKDKNLHQFTLEGTDFSSDVPLSDDGYYEYIITANYYGNTITFLVKLIDLKGIELDLLADKKVYYGTEIAADFFNVTCVYTNGDKIPLADSGLANDFSVKCNTAIQGGDAVATAQIYNAAYGINVAQDVNVTVQKPEKLEVTLSQPNANNVDGEINISRFTIVYKYADGTTAPVHNTDPNLIINYDTSAPTPDGETFVGKVKIGDMSATFNYKVSDARFDADTEALKNELANRGTVKLLAPKFPTFWLVTIIVVAVVAVLVAAFCVLKFVFKVEFKFKKFDLDEIF